MGLAIDTTLGVATMGASPALTAVTFATGDSGGVRSFGTSAFAQLQQIIGASTGAYTAQVKSPMFHDDVLGIQYETSESPSVLLLPPEVGQGLVSQDTLAVSALGVASAPVIVGLVHYYSDLSGSSARLHMWSDVSGIIKSIKPLEVAVAASATIGQWSDTVITTTEDLLHANTDYAVLGYVSDVALGMVGIRGQETGNLRVCGPGATATDDTSEWFVRASDRHNQPQIPVINAANKNSIYVSVADKAASTAAKVQLILAELTANLSS